MLKGLTHGAGSKRAEKSPRKRQFPLPPPHAARGPMLPAEPHFVVLMFPDNTANITVKYGQFDREHTKFHYLPVLISDNGVPSLTGTGTLTVAVCKCNEHGEFTFCEEMAAQAGVSIQALVAIFLCILTITGQCLVGRGETLRRLHRRGRVPAQSSLDPMLPCKGYRDTDVEL